MKYLSLFSGIGAGEQAIKELGLDWECVGYSEIDPYAIQIYEKHFPNHKNFGDITKIDINKLPDFDLMFGGSPCQDLSIAKKNREGLKGRRSNLFYKFVEILEIKKPKYFLLENVASMPKKDKQIITDILGVEPIMIDASLVSAQQRKRLFWCNWKVEQPKDKRIYLKDILEDGEPFKDKAYCLTVNGKDFINDFVKRKQGNYVLKSYCLPATYHKENVKSLIKRKKKGLVVGTIKVAEIGKGGQGDRIYSIEGKSVCLSANGGGRGAKTGLYLINWYNRKIKINGKAKTLGTIPQCKTAVAGQSITDLKNYVRKLTPVECERLQCFPDGFTEGLSNTRRYKALGNSFNVEVIKHILKSL